MKLSEQLEIVIGILEQCVADHRWYGDQLKDAESDENNIRHETEGLGADVTAPPKGKRLSELAKKWQDSLIRRRVAKNSMEISQTLYDYLQSDVGKAMLNALKLNLGKTRQIETKVESRVYVKRLTDTAPINTALQEQFEKMVKSKRSRKPKE